MPSDPIYKTAPLRPRNPTNGSWWMPSDPFYKTAPPSSLESHQRQLVDASDPFYKTRSLRPRIPPTGVGELFRSSLQTSPPTVPESPQTAVGGSFRSFL